MPDPPEVPPDPAPRAWSWAWWPVGFGLGSLPVFLGVLNHDVAWYLHAAGRMMAGDRLYVDLIETNPPLIVWCGALPRLLARALGISEIVALRVVVLGAVGASIELTGRALRVALPDRPGGRRAILWLCLFALLGLPGYDFAQREHLMLASLLPYLMMASSRAMGRRPGTPLAVAVGATAGVGLALKPHFVLPWLAIEAYLAASGRSWRIWARPEALAVVAVGLGYSVAIAAITPEYLGLIRRVGPAYASMGRPSWLDLWNSPATFVTAVATLGLLASRPKGPGGECLRLVLVADLGFLAIALLQNKGYSYHFYPPFALAVLLVGLLAVGTSAGSPSDRAGLSPVVTKGIFLALILTAVLGRVGESLAWRGRPEASDSPLGRMIRATKAESEGGSIFVFSPSVAASFPLVSYSGAGWASRHPALWFLPSFHPRGSDDASRVSTEAMGESERFLLGTVVEELLARRPALLFVDESGSPGAFGGRAFFYLDYYSLDPRFAAFLADYEPREKVDDFRIYRRASRRAP